MSSPLQTTIGNTAAVAVLFISLQVSIVLSLVIGLRGVRSYRESHDYRIVLLVIGILLLSGVPTSINIVFTTFTAIPGWTVAAAVDLIRLFGLVIILVSIYD